MPTDVTRTLDALARARKWLLDAGMSSESAGEIGKALVGVSVCERAAAGPRASAELKSLARHMAERVTASATSGTFDPYDHDAKLILLCLRTLDECQVPRPRALERFATEIAIALGKRSVIPARYAGEATLLSALHHLPPRLRFEHDDPAPSSPTFHALLTGGPQFVRSTCASVAASTVFGLRRAAFPTLREALPIVLIGALRAYDLELGSLVLRTCVYAGLARTAEIAEAITFLLDHQLKDGRFGHLEAEAERIAIALDREDVGLALHLPITTACAWALAEAALPGERLFRQTVINRSSEEARHAPAA